MKIIPLTIGSRSSDIRQLDCEVLRSRRKTLAIHIKHRKVEVRTPLHATQREIRAFLEGNKQWIEVKLREESVRYRESLRIEKGRKIFYRAREREIVFQENLTHKVIVTADQFIIKGPSLNTSRAREQVESFLLEKAAKNLPDRTRALARYLRVSGKLKQVKLRKTKSKWGHCTSAGVIQFNWLIMLAPDSIIDYMIAHEVCHLVHMDHSADFWNLVESVCPDYEYYVQWLKAHEHRLWL
ncbi:MAG: M48 family metallopeptidase [Gammaproteobacteria bacterium]|nr:M48 family metallopeptidase [Gammaproteobacteria bacterium]